MMYASVRLLSLTLLRSSRADERQRSGAKRPSESYNKTLVHPNRITKNPLSLAN